MIDGMHCIREPVSSPCSSRKERKKRKNYRMYSQLLLFNVCAVIRRWERERSINIYCSILVVGLKFILFCSIPSS